jgi:hypothetical protein
MYEALVLKLRTWEKAGLSNSHVFIEAADAIEELKKFYQIMADAYETEVTKERWIPVTEELPKKPQDYPNCKLREYYFLVTLETNAVVCREYDFDNKRWPGTIRVTHWMPLPDPPKDEEI